MILIDAILHRGRSENIKTVIIGGEPVLRDRQYTHINKQDILNYYADSLKNIVTDDDIKRRELFKQIVPHVRNYFQTYAESPITDWMPN